MVRIIKLLELLVRSKVDFVLVGGAAAAAYGSPLVTQDLDLCGDMGADNLERLAKALLPYDARHRMTPDRPPFTPEGARESAFKNLYLHTDLGQLDFLGTIKGLGGYAEADAASQSLPIGEVSIRILTLANLIKAKEAMGRPRDLENVEILRHIENERNRKND